MPVIRYSANCDQKSWMSQAESTTAERNRKLAELLDSKFRIPGTNIRFGIDPIIGLVPGLGDWLGGFLSLYFLVYAAVLEARISVLLRMLLNILLDVVIGTIPLLGEIFDVGWKANLRNAKLLDQHIQDPEHTEQRSKILIWSVCLLSVAIVLALLFVVGKLFASLIEAIL